MLNDASCASAQPSDARELLLNRVFALRTVGGDEPLVGV